MHGQVIDAVREPCGYLITIRFDDVAVDADGNSIPVVKTVHLDRADVVGKTLAQIRAAIIDELTNDRFNAVRGYTF